MQRRLLQPRPRRLFLETLEVRRLMAVVLGGSASALESPLQSPAYDTVLAAPVQAAPQLQLLDGQGKPIEIDDPANTIVVGAATWCGACDQFKQLLRSPDLAEAIDGLRLVFAFDNEIGAAAANPTANPAGIAGAGGVQNPKFLQDLPGEVAFLGPNSVRPDSFPAAYNPASGQFDFSAKRAIKAWLALQPRTDAPAEVAPPSPAVQVAASHSGELPGDFNDDHLVDGADLSVWGQNYGSTVDLDADQDGDVDGNDFLVWQRNFGASFQTAQEHVIFITNSTFSVNAAAEPNPGGTEFGGLSSADFHCTQAASLAGVFAGWNGTDRIYKALLSTSSVNASERLLIEDRIVNTNGDIVALDGDDLWDGNLTLAVNYNEFGQLLSTNSIFWTGSTANGTHSQSCQNYTQVISQIANVGLSQTANSWFNQAQLACDQSYRLVCISPAQDQPSEEVHAGVLGSIPPRVTGQTGGQAGGQPADGELTALATVVRFATPTAPRAEPQRHEAAFMPVDTQPARSVVAPTVAPHATDWQNDFDQALEALPKREALVVELSRAVHRMHHQ